MHDHANTSGIYNDVNNHWMVKTVNGGQTELYHNGIKRIQTTSGGVVVNGRIQREAHNAGHLEGGHNNIGSSATKTSPIYTIGSSYNPDESTLSNMYGIGYSHSDASFITGGGASGWGMYVAADGDSRVFLSGTYGHVVSTGEHFAGVGSAGTPGYTFTDDTNTGMFRNGGDNIGFSTAGTNRVNISNAKLALLAGLGLDIETASGNVRGLISASETIPHLRIATSTNESIGFFDGGTSGTENIRIEGSGILIFIQEI